MMDYDTQEIEVITPSKSKFVVLNEAEKGWYEEKAKEYLSHNIFQNVSDLQEIDRMLMFELFCWRYGQWISAEVDYDGQDVDIEALTRSATNYSKEIRAIKDGMGIDKATRDKDKGEDIAQYLIELNRRAKAMGVHRNEQAVAAITLMQELIAVVQLHDNCTDEERKENKVTEEDIVSWIREVATPQFQDIDTKFRATEQKYWIASQ